MSDPASQKKTFDKGLALYSRKKFAEALPYFEEITLKSLLVLKHYYTGLTLVQLGKFEQGLEEYKKITEVPAAVSGVEYDKLMYGLYINMGSLLQLLAKKNGSQLLEEAINCYEYALQVKDNDPRLWNNLGNAYLDLEQYTEAIGKFNKAIDLDDEYPEPHYCKSLAFEFTSQYEKAIEELKLALKWKNRSKVYLNRIIALTFGIKDFKEAQLYARKFVEYHPDEPAGYKNLALILYNLEQYEKSYENYQKLIEIQPDFNDPEVSSIFVDLEEKMYK